MDTIIVRLEDTYLLHSDTKVALNLNQFSSNPRRLYSLVGAIQTLYHTDSLNFMTVNVSFASGAKDWVSGATVSRV